MSDSLIQRALDRANQADARIESHEVLCAERYKNITDKIDEMKRWIGWGAMTGFGMVTAVLAFLAIAVFNNNERGRLDQAAQIQALQRDLGSPAAGAAGPTASR